MRITALIGILSSFILNACSNPQCGAGKRKIGTVCIAIDAGQANDAADGTSEDPAEEGDEHEADRIVDAGPQAPEKPSDSGMSTGTQLDAAHDSKDRGVGLENVDDAGSPGSAEQDSATEAAPLVNDAGTKPTADAETNPNPDASPVTVSCSGAACAARDECATNPCPNGGVCTNTAVGRSCDYCSPNPCQKGGTCESKDDGFICHCPGNAPGTRCELEACNALTVRTRADVDGAKACAEIDGDLMLSTTFSEISASDFPNLTRVAGRLVITNSVLLSSVTFSALTTIDGSLVLAANSLSDVHFPALTSIGGPGLTLGLEVVVATLSELEMPALQEIQGSVQIDAPKLCSANFADVTSVVGTVELGDLYNLPYSATAPLRNSATEKVSAKNVGCCTLLDSFQCTTASPSCECP